MPVSALAQAGVELFGVETLALVYVIAFILGAFFETTRKAEKLEKIAEKAAKSNVLLTLVVAITLGGFGAAALATGVWAPIINLIFGILGFAVWLELGLLGGGHVVEVFLALYETIVGFVMPKKKSM